MKAKAYIKTKIKIKKGDTVRVMVGKDRGKEGQVEKVLPKKGKVFIPGLNEFKRHVKSRGEGQPGEIMTFSRPFPISNVMVVDGKSKLPTRIGIRVDGDKKVRVSRKSKTDLN